MTGIEIITQLISNDEINLNNEVALATEDGHFDGKDYAMFHIKEIKAKNGCITLLMFDDIRFKENKE